MPDDALTKAAVADYASKRKSLKRIPVPEWTEFATDGKEIFVYCYEVPTIGDWEAIAPYLSAGSGTYNMVTAQLYAFVLGALDENGKRLFTTAAMDEIRRGGMKLDLNVVARIVHEMGWLRPDDETIDDQMQALLTRGDETGEINRRIADICIALGRLPDEVRNMTIDDFHLIYERLKQGHKPEG